MLRRKLSRDKATLVPSAPAATIRSACRYQRRRAGAGSVDGQVRKIPITLIDRVLSVIACLQQLSLTAVIVLPPSACCKRKVAEISGGSCAILSRSDIHYVVVDLLHHLIQYGGC